MKHRNALENQMKRHAQRALEGQAKPRTGIVSGYDPSHYAVKVLIQPENILTGWMPLGSPWIGNQWGFYAPPNIGDPIEMHYENNDPNAPYACMKFFNTSIQPLAVPSGEFWVVHKSGSFLKLTNDTKMVINATGDLDATVGGSTNLTSVGNVTMTTPNLIVDGNIQATGDITDRINSTNQSMDNMRTIYNEHHHLPSDVTPTPQMEA